MTSLHLLRALLVALLATPLACAGPSGGSGGVAYAGGAEGSVCFPTTQAEGCLALPQGFSVMTCTAAGTWATKKACAANQYCVESPAGDASAPSKLSASCKDLPSGGTTDAGGASDTGSAAATDTGSTSTTDTGSPDTGAPDTGAPDTGAPDTGAPDTGAPDTGAPDTGAPDTGGGLEHPLPKVTLEDINPGSATAGQQVSIAQFAGNYIAVLMGAGWCASCKAQASYMEKIRKDAEAKGRKDIVFIVVNDKSAASSSYQKAMYTCGYSVCSPKGVPVGFPILQGTSAMGWQSFTDPGTGQKGKKNDCFIYGPNGKFIFKHIGKGTVNLTQFNKEVRQSVGL